MTTLAAPHIELREGASGIRPRIAGKGVLVQAVVVWYQVLHRTPEQIAEDHGLTLGEVGAALSYYYDHREEIELLILEENHLIDGMKACRPSLVADNEVYP